MNRDKKACSLYVYTNVWLVALGNTYKLQNKISTYYIETYSC